MKEGDKVKFKRTERTISLGIADGPGVVVRANGNRIYVLYTDPIFGPAGPYKMDEEELDRV